VDWHGIVLDFTGHPLPAGEVAVKLKESFVSSGPAPTVIRKESPVEEGRFRIAGLVPGRFDVELLFPDQLGSIRWGEICFFGPGIVEKDIHVGVSGGVVRGRVIDEATGREPMGEKLLVKAFRNPDREKPAAEALVGAEDGSFCLRCLPAGSYLVVAMGRITISEFCRGLQVGEGQVVDDLRLPIRERGFLRIEFSGFSNEDLLGFDWMLVRKDGLKGNLPSRRAAETIPLAPGEWEFRLEKDGRVLFLSSFAIVSGSTSPLSITRDDLSAVSQDR